MFKGIREQTNFSESEGLSCQRVKHTEVIRVFPQGQFLNCDAEQKTEQMPQT